MINADSQSNERFQVNRVQARDGVGRVETNVKPVLRTGYLPMTHEFALNRCYELAQKSPCAKRKVGSLIINHGGIVGEGWNHPPNPACQDCETLCAGGIRKGIASGTRGELCYSLHAEQAAIIAAGKEARGGMLYAAGFDTQGNKFLKDHSLPPGDPHAGFYCTLCIRCIWEAGLRGIMVDTVSGPAFESLEDAWKTSYAVANSI